MNEFYRIVTNRYVIMITIMLFVLNGILMYRDASGDISEDYKVYRQEFEAVKELPHEERMEYLTAYESEIAYFQERYTYEHMIKQMTGDPESEMFLESFEQSLAILKEQYPEYTAIYDDNPEKYDPEGTGVLLDAISKLKGKIDYIDGFPKIYEQMKINALLIDKVGAFQTADGYSKENVKKTLKDFEAFQNIQVELVDEEPIKTLYNFKITDFILIGFVAIIIMAFIQERKLALWSIVHTCAKGRFGITFNRWIILAIVSVLSIALFYLENFFICSLVYGDFGSLDISVQSVSIFSNCPYDISILEYLVINILLKSLAIFVIGIILWLIVSAFYNMVPIILVSGVFLWVEYLCYSKIMDQSNLNILKFVNIFSALYANEEVMDYRNIKLFGSPVNTAEMIILIAAVALILATVIVFVTNMKKQTVYVRGRISALVDNTSSKLQEKLKFVRGSRSIFFNEAYKFLVMHGGILVLVLVIIGCINQYEKKEYLLGLDVQMSLMYYEQLEGEITEEKIEQVKLLREDVEEEMLAGMDNTIIQSKLSVLESMESLISRNEKLAGKLGENLWFVSEYGYEELLGKGSFETQYFYSIEIIFFVILLTFAIFAVENQNNAKLIIRTTAKGRRNLLYKKLGFVALATLIVLAAVSIVDYKNATGTFAMGSFGAPVQSLSMYKDFPLHVSIGGFLVLLYVVRYLMVLSMATVVMLISYQSKKTMEALFISLFILCIPAGMYYIGINVFEYLSFVKVISLAPILYGNSFAGVMWLLPMVVSFAVGLGSFIWIRKKWC